MLKIATSADVRRSLVREGRSRVKKFTWREAARKTAEVYQNAIEHPAEITLFQRSMFENLLRADMAPFETGMTVEAKANFLRFPSFFEKLRSTLQAQ